MNIDRIPSVRIMRIVCLLISVSFLASCTKQDIVNPTVTPNPGGGNPPIASPIPKTPPAIVYPGDNKPLDLTAEIELGRHLFYDKQMSVDGSTSCASCHQPQNGFSDVFPVSIGMQGQHGTRNAPTLTNVAFNSAFTWDGKFPSLEKHAPGPMFNSLEMGNNFSNGFDSSGGGDTVGNGYNSKPGNNDTLFLFARLDGNQNSRSAIVDPNSTRTDVNNTNYYTLLNKAWGPVTVSIPTVGGKAVITKTAVAFTLDIIAKSIAAFERTLLSTNSTFDNYNNGAANAINADAQKGFQLFIDPNKANCVSCHSGYNFTDQKFHNDGSLDNPSGTAVVDVGRAGITHNAADNYKFKTPTLRNVSLTAPWMHDGHVANDQANTELSLEKIIKVYNKGGTGIHGAEIKPLGLSDQEIAYIGAFLMTLQDGSFGHDPKLSNPWSN
jgi:cytochrome c peroxidase